MPELLHQGGDTQRVEELDEENTGAPQENRLLDEALANAYRPDYSKSNFRPDPKLSGYSDIALTVGAAVGLGGTLGFIGYGVGTMTGGTIGFIVADVPGAITGMKIGGTIGAGLGIVAGEMLTIAFLQKE